MNLVAFLFSQQEILLDKWFELVLADYPAETAGFLRREKDRFANPVGYQLREGMEKVLRELWQPKASENINSIIAQLLKIRAVQDFSPSRAVGFLLFLKQVIREMVRDADLEERFWRELPEMEQRIDALTLLAFDLYTHSREELYRIRVKELKNSIPRIYRDAVVRHCTGE